MNQKLMTLDFGQDTVIYEGNTLPTGVIQIAREAAMKMLVILSVTSPFSYMDITRHRKRIETVFTTESCVRYADCVKQANENLLQLTDVADYADALTLYRYAAVFGHLAYSLGEYQKAIRC